MTRKNESGIYPTEYKVVVLPDKAEEKTKGGVFIPDESKERQQYASIEGTLIAISPHAFTYEDWKDSEDLKPKAGDKVLFAKFAGIVRKGKDGNEYRIINDKDVVAVLD